MTATRGFCRRGQRSADRVEALACGCYPIGAGVRLLVALSREMPSRVETRKRSSRRCWAAVKGAFHILHAYTYRPSWEARGRLSAFGCVTHWSHYELYNEGVAHSKKLIVTMSHP